MRRLRTVRRSVWILVGLFLVAQFAGVVSSPLAHAHAAFRAAGEHAAHHHDHADGRHAAGHRHDGCAYPGAAACDDQGDQCCALHAFFAGILPPVTEVENAGIGGETFRPDVTDVAQGVEVGRLDRPPRPLS
jgi:hypothetical protein